MVSFTEFAHSSADVGPPGVKNAEIRKESSSVDVFAGNGFQILADQNTSHCEIILLGSLPDPSGVSKSKLNSRYSKWRRLLIGHNLKLLGINDSAAFLDRLRQSCNTISEI